MNYASVGCRLGESGDRSNLRTSCYSFLLSPIVLLIGLAFLTISRPALGQNFAYVTSAAPNNLVMAIDLSTKHVTKIPVGSDPQQIAATPDGKRVYTANFVDNSVSVIDTDASSLTFNTVVATIAVGLAPFGVAVTPDGSRVYITNFHESTVSVIDANPSSPSFETVIATIPVPSGAQGIAFTPDGSRAYVGLFALSVIDTDPASTTYNTVLSTVSFPPSIAPRILTLALTPDGTRAYLPIGIEFVDSLLLVDTDPTSATFNTFISTIALPPIAFSAVFGVAVTPDGTRGYATEAANTGTNPFPAFIAVIDTDPRSSTYNATLTTIPEEQASLPFALAIASDGNTAYVVLNGASALSLIDTNRLSSTYNTVVDNIPFGFPANAQSVALVGSPKDTTPPLITCDSPDRLWHGADVNIICHASDAGSGLLNLGDATFSLSTNVPVGTETDHATTNSRVVSDKAGNSATAGPIAPIMVDKKPPFIVLTTPTGGTYLLGQTVLASYSCSDGGSGVAACAGTTPNGVALNTSSPGTFNFTVNAADQVNNVSFATSSYTVVYNVCLLYDPSKSHRTGSTIPIKIELCDANGTNVSISAVTVHAVGLTQVSTGASTTVEDSGNANPDNDFRFDSTLGIGGGYIFNLSTSSLTGTYALNFTAGTDPQLHSVTFQVRP